MGCPTNKALTDKKISLARVRSNEGGTILFKLVNRSVDTTSSMFVGMGILVYLMVNNFIRGLGGSFSATKHLERDVGDIMIWPSSVRHAHVGRIHIYCNW